MPRINRRIRTMAQPRRSRAELIELLIGPNGDSVFDSSQDRDELWTRVRAEISAEFAERWYAAQDNPRPFARIAEQYARQVVAGELLTCERTQQACRRHLEDLKRDDWRYEFDIRKAERICRFAEMLPHVKGNWAARGELIHLEPWQAFGLCSIFGWVKKETRTRRFSLAYEEVPRKNAKSIKAAIIGLYMLACDDEFGAEIYSGATSEFQAHEVFRPARQMMERSPDLAQVLGITVAAKGLKIPEDGSRFEPVIGKPGDGAMPHGAIVDEYHEHDSDALVDTLRTGMGARTQPLLLIITTAGTNTAGPCKLLQGDVCQILDGSIKREEVFGIIYSIDPGDDWTLDQAIVKSNPNLDVSVFKEYLLTEQSAALASPRKQGVFQTKHQNVWVGALRAFFDVRRWNMLADPTLHPQQFAGCQCVASIDLAFKRDFTAGVEMFKKTVKGKDHYYPFVRVYLPEAQATRPDAPHYQTWRKHIRIHSGATVDFDTIIDDSVAGITAGHARELVCDPWNAPLFSQAVEKRSKATIVFLDQKTNNLSAAMKELDVVIAEGRIHHQGNPVVAWMLGNVMAREDANENVLPRKEAGREENKIDAAVAIIMCLGRLMLMAPKKSVYSTRGILSLPVASAVGARA